MVLFIVRIAIKSKQIEVHAATTFTGNHLKKKWLCTAHYMEIVCVHDFIVELSSVVNLFINKFCAQLEKSSIFGFGSFFSYSSSYYYLLL